MHSAPEIERYKAKLDQDPHSRVFAQLADAYRKAGMLDEAIQVCQKGLSQHPNYASAYIVLGRAYFEKGDLPVAQEAFQRVLHLDPDNLLVHRFLGQLAEARDEIPEAIVAYRAALALNPFDKEIRAALEQLESRSPVQEESAAPEVSERRPEAPPPEAEPLATETLADLYAAEGFYDRAIEIYEKLRAADPEREDLNRKYREALAHTQAEGAAEPRPTPDSQGGHELIQLLEAWHEAFRSLKTVRGEEG
ncbi:MAG: tetratricopeptide repeat protein [Candidatus Methylomirabilales bacterium]